MTKPGPKSIKSAHSDPAALKGMTTKDALAYWLALPSKHRNPVNQKGLAQLVGVSEERLCQIKREEGFMDSVMEYRKIFFKQFTSDIIEAMADTARQGNERAAKLFLQVVEDFKETTRQEKESLERKEFVFMLGEDRLTELRKLIAEERNLGALDVEIIHELPEGKKDNG